MGLLHEKGWGVSNLWILRSRYAANVDDSWKIICSKLVRITGQ